jgi:hypothetical protein
VSKLIQVLVLVIVGLVVVVAAGPTITKLAGVLVPLVLVVGVVVALLKCVWFYTR